MELKGKIAIVTGGASGIGKSIYELLLKNGSKVVVLDINKQAIDCLKKNENTLKIVCDISNEKMVSNAINKIKNQFKTIDILINNAGILHSEPLINIISKNKKHNLANWKKTIDINLTAPFLMGSYVAEQMVMNRTKGVIINISSISASGNIGQSAYSAAKAGLEAMTKVWAKELGVFGIRSVTVAPGFIDTKSMHDAMNNDFIESLKKKIPIKKLGKEFHIAEAVKFVIENEYLNGKTLHIDGGLVI